MLVPKYTASITLVGKGGSISAVASDAGVVAALAPFFVGPAGPIGDAGGALLVANKLSELSGSSEAQLQAQANLGLGVSDPVAYYILAKA